MRVAIVNKYAHLTGGADQHCLALSVALVHRGHEVKFLSTSDRTRVGGDGIFVSRGVTHGSRDVLRAPAQAAVAANAVWNREAAAGMQRLIDEFRPDVVHTHKLYPQLSVAPVVVAARSGLPVVQTLHDFEMISASPIDARGGRWDTDETRIRFKALNSLLRPVHRRVHAPRVSAFVAVSRFVERIHAAHGIEATVLPNFVAYAGHGDAQPPTFDEREGILFLGRLRPEKGALDVVELARHLPAIPVTVVGSGDLEEEIRLAAKSLPNLKAAGFIPGPDVRQFLRRARVVVIPSRCQDAGPLVPLEAMANATPVVAYPMGGLGEYVCDAGGGRLVPVEPEILAVVAAQLHDDRAAWESFSRRGYAAVAERHTPDAYAERLEHVYEQVLRSPVSA